jgi:hypothetical protein
MIKKIDNILGVMIIFILFVGIISAIFIRITSPKVIFEIYQNGIKVDEKCWSTMTDPVRPWDEVYYRKINEKCGE